MRNNFKTIILVMMLVGLNSPLFAEQADSTSVKAPAVTTVLQAYMLAQGTVATTFGQYEVNKETTTQRCAPQTSPALYTSVNSVGIYGSAQAIQGIKNGVTLNTSTYVISGHLSAPNNVSFTDSGASINYQVWCQPNQTA